MKQEEGKFKQKVIKALEECYGKNIKILATQERGRNGVLDLHICLFGSHMEIELKVDGKAPTRLQKINIDKCIKAGGYAFFTTPSTWDHHFSVIRNKWSSTRVPS